MGELTDIPEGKGTVAVATKPKSRKGRVANRKMVDLNGSRVTPKEAQFIKGLAEGKTQTQAALDAYDTDSPMVADSIARENLDKPRLQNALADVFEETGITAKSIAEILKDAMAATKTASLQGQVFPSDEPDHSVRVGAAKAAAQLAGMGADGGGDKAPVNFNFGTQNFIKNAELNS